ncbi:probable NOT transcription complex subunit VIP2 isoform X2 [Amaranthus tricolor]|uniref:probable NOT transcription complex subunit VIP2 isoform X2 n=1 Tax=Amaranthus tricolor TaxID=29722 RepID=UPI00258C7FB3|nr:probable NOT transcription complex subunit VIP2 isoform X2 [Amaranthus tricolor]
MHGGFNVPNMSGTLTSRNSSMNNVGSGGVQQPTGNVPGGRFASNNIPVALSQMSHGSSHGGYPGVTNRGGLGVSPVLGNAGPRVTGSMGSMVGSGNIGRSIGSGGGLSIPGLASRLNMSTNSGSGSLGVQGPNRLSSGVLQQASPQVLSMFGNSYTSAGGSLSQNHAQAMNNLSSMGMLSDENANDSSPFTLNDFPQLGSRPNSAGGPQGQIGSLRKQGLGVSPIVQQNQEFSIQNEDFPALPGFKGGNAEYGMDFQQKEQIHDNGVSMQSQHFSMGRSPGFNLGGMYSSHRPQQQQHTLSNSMPPGISLRSMNSPSGVSNISSYEQQFMQQYQPQQNQSQFRLQQMPSINQTFRDQGIKPIQSPQPTTDPYGLLGLLSVIRMSDPDLTSLALGIDLTTLGLNLNSSENLHKTFASPWSDEPIKGEPEFTIPECYYAKQPPPLSQAYFAKFQLPTLFYIFYSMPRDEAQIYAANELYNRGWFYHKDLRLWFMRVPNMEPLVKTNAYERGSYLAFDPNTWDTSIKENCVIHYELIEKRPALHHQ